MLSDYVAGQIRGCFPYTPTPEQDKAIELLSAFCTLPTNQKLFVLKGYAGTGKTSLVSALVKAMQGLEQKCVLLAPTGRAAKVLSGYANASAWSIHKEIYRQKSVTEFSFSINYNRHKDTLFIIDEASMISNQSGEGQQFGSGRLLDDLMEYVYGGDNCCMILMGDTAQLLPVGQQESPALNMDYLAGYGMHIMGFELTEVVRQAGNSGILENATHLREIISGNSLDKMKFDLGLPDLQRLGGADLIDTLQSSYSEVGEENSIIVCYSNKRANLYNKGVRNQVLLQEDELSSGDLLIVTKNNYFCCRNYDNIDFIANGDIAEVVRIGKRIEMYGFRFADVTLRLLDYDSEIDVRLILDSLHTDTPSDMSKMNQQLFEAVSEDYADIGNKRERYKQMRNNEYLNALQVKFAYALTCHKAQGGQWSHVFIDQGYLQEEQVNTQYYQWLYTALTRATERAWLVNFSDFFFDKNEKD